MKLCPTREAGPELANQITSQSWAFGLREAPGNRCLWPRSPGKHRQELSHMSKGPWAPDREKLLRLMRY